MQLEKLAVRKSDQGDSCKTDSFAHSSLNAQSVIIIAPIGLIGVIQQAFLLGDLALSDNAGLKVSYDIIDLLGAELGWSRVVSNTARASACTFLKGRHSSALASATNHELEFIRIQSCPSQISSGW